MALTIIIRQDVNGLELYPFGKRMDSRAVCPEDTIIECKSDKDCLDRIAVNSLDENCSKCICWNVPVCNIKK